MIWESKVTQISINNTVVKLTTIGVMESVYHSLTNIWSRKNLTLTLVPPQVKKVNQDLRRENVLRKDLPQRVNNNSSSTEEVLIPTLTSLNPTLTTFTTNLQNIRVWRIFHKEAIISILCHPNKVSVQTSIIMWTLSSIQVSNIIGQVLIHRVEMPTSSLRDHSSNLRWTKILILIK